MRRGGGKGKGTGFEWKVAKRLSEWLTDGKDKTQLVRSTLSGGWRRGNKVSARHEGDLAANGEAGENFRARFVVECKFYREVDFWDYWTCSPNGGNFMGWWIHLCNSAPVVNKVVLPLLIFQANRRPTMIVMPVLLLQAVQLHDRGHYITFPEYGCAVLPLEAVLELTPEAVLAACDELVQSSR